VLGAYEQGKNFTLTEDALSVHGVVFGSTGSGKTGFLVVLMEEALINRVPVVGLDVKARAAKVA
jgi:DNA helicase HerA-like ATPase